MKQLTFFLNMIFIAGGHPEDEEVAGETDHDKDIDAITGPAGCLSPWSRSSSSAGSLSPHFNLFIDEIRTFLTSEDSSSQFFSIFALCHLFGTNSREMKGTFQN